MVDFDKINNLIKQVEGRIETTKDITNEDNLSVGVDLGTAYIVVIVLDQEMEPVACELEFAQVVRDGLVVDYIGAIDIVKRLKGRIEDRLGVELTKAAIAVPPGTSKGDSKTHMYVVEGAGMEVTTILDEPTAANSVLKVKDGAVVDIGGGTTGISIFEDGEVIYTADEATGGTHLSLTIAGNRKIEFEEAEKIKTCKEKQSEVFSIVLPVIQKMGHIVKDHISNFKVDGIYLVGGTSCLEGIETVIQKETGIITKKPDNPFLVTPLGIAMNCKV